MRKRKWMPERGSQRVLFVIVAITAVVFAAYYLFGFNHPYADDPDFNEPRLTNYHTISVRLVLPQTFYRRTKFLVIAFLIGSSQGVEVNGKQYDDALWLRTADMFVIASVAMIVLAVGLVAFASIKSYLNKRSK